MFLIDAYVGRTSDYTFTIYEADGTELQIKVTDSVLLKIGTNSQIPTIDIKSGTPSANGSTVSFTVGTGDCTLHLAQGDASLLVPGAYDMEITVIDTAVGLPAGTVKYADFGVLSMHASQLGNLT